MFYHIHRAVWTEKNERDYLFLFNSDPLSHINIRIFHWILFRIYPNCSAVIAAETKIWKSQSNFQKIFGYIFVLLRKSFGKFPNILSVGHLLRRKICVIWYHWRNNSRIILIKSIWVFNWCVLEFGKLCPIYRSSAIAYIVRYDYKKIYAKNSMRRLIPNLCRSKMGTARCISNGGFTQNLATKFFRPTEHRQVDPSRPQHFIW